MAKLTKDESIKIAEILSPLDKDPIRNETLNPMSRVLRKIKGLPELIPDKEDTLQELEQEAETIDGGIELNDDAIIESETDTPPQMKYFDENDVDIDELLNDAPDLIAGQPIGLKKEVEDKNPSLQTDDTDPFSLSGQANEDPFADSGKNDDSNDLDPFGSLENNDIDLNTTPAIENDDPFGADLSDSKNDDPFGGFGDTENATPVADTTDPFADMDSTSNENPFEDVGTAFNKSSIPNAMDTDPFADVVSSGIDSDDDPFADIGESKSIPDYYPIGGIGESTTTPTKD